MTKTELGWHYLCTSLRKGITNVNKWNIDEWNINKCNING